MRYNNKLLQIMQISLSWPKHTAVSNLLSQYKYCITRGSFDSPKIITHLDVQKIRRYFDAQVTSKVCAPMPSGIYPEYRISEMASSLNLPNLPVSPVFKKICWR